MLSHISELQQTLLHDDAYIPGVVQIFSRLTMESLLSVSNGNPEPVRDGINRPIADNTHSWRCSEGNSIELTLRKKKQLNSVTLILDSALDKLTAMSHLQKDDQLTAPPDVMPKIFCIEGKIGGRWIQLAGENCNHMRLFRIAVNRQVEAVRFTLEKTWGAPASNIYALYVE